MAARHAHALGMPGTPATPGPSPLPQPLRNRVLDWMYTLFVHDANEKSAIQRAATALGYGLNPQDYVSTFPGSTVNIITTPPYAAPPPVAPDPVPPPQPTPTTPPTPDGGTAANPTPAPSPPTPPPPPPQPATVPKKGTSAWKWALGAAALTAAGVGVGWGVGALMTKPGTPATSPATTAPAPAPDKPTAPSDWQLKIYEEGKE